MIRPDLRKEHVGLTFNDLKAVRSEFLNEVVDPVHVGHTSMIPIQRSRPHPRSLSRSRWPFARNIRSFKKPRLSQIVQIQSNLQKSIALEMQTSCSFIKKTKCQFLSFESKIFRIEVAQPIFFTCNLLNYIFQEFICF